MTTKTHAFFGALNTGARNKTQALPLQPRASLEGLEVAESSFGQWLEAGGDRRSQPRQDGKRADTQD